MKLSSQLKKKKQQINMSHLDIYKNFTNTSDLYTDLNTRQPKTFQTPLLGFLLAATLLSRVTQAKPYFLGYGQTPWVPLKSSPNYLLPIPSPWHPVSGSYHPQYTTTSSPQILPPPLGQQQIIHIHDKLPASNTPDVTALRDHGHQHHKFEDFYENAEPSNIDVSEESDLSLLTTESTFEKLESEEIENDIKSDYDNEAESSNFSYSFVNSTESKDNETGGNTILEVQTVFTTDLVYVNDTENVTETAFLKQIESSNDLTENYDDLSVNTSKRSRRTTPRIPIIKRGGSRRPALDYEESRYKNRKRPIRRRPTSSGYKDYNSSNKQANRRKRRPPTKVRNRPNRRPINREPEYYGSEYDDYDYYPDSENIFARQGIDDDEDTSTSTTETTRETTTTAITTEGTTTVTTQSQNNSYGYTYGPPVQTGYGPPSQTGYGPSNGNEHISITYPPISGPGRDVLAPLLDSWYNQYSKNSIIRRLQELLQQNNFYNNQQYDVNYPENF